MIEVLHVDSDLIVAVKPAGTEAQSAKGFAADMVSGLKKYLVINRLCTSKEPYIGVIHRLDKPVSGVMVYARTKKAAAALSSQLQNGKMEKIYQAVVCGKPVDNVDNFVDYLKKSVDGNVSQCVDKDVPGAKRAELSYRCLGTVDNGVDFEAVSLMKIHLKTGRHHQIRVQMVAHGLPVCGDQKYGRQSVPADSPGGARIPLALCAAELSFWHPATGERLYFAIKPSGGAFDWFSCIS